MYFFVFRTLHIGGVETLLLRECSWYKKRGKTVIICQFVSQIAMDSFKNVGIDFKVLPKWRPQDIFDTISSMGSVAFVKFFSYKHYLEFALKYSKLNWKCLSYCVHPDDLRFAKSLKSVKPLIAPFFRRAISCSIHNNSLIFMDKNTALVSLEYYGLEDLINKCAIVHLPFNCSNSLPKPYDNNHCSILTIARATFPYKGYILGLIDTLDSNVTRFKNFSLTIISTGEDIQILKQKISSVKYIKDRITLIEGVSPEQLSNFYRKADIYVGMGTTILEASNYGVPAIVVRYDTNEFEAIGLFSDNPDDLGSVIAETHNGYNDLIRIMDISAQEYIELQRCAKNALYDNYNQDDILNTFENWKCKSNYLELPMGIKSILLLYFKLSRCFLDKKKN